MRLPLPAAGTRTQVAVELVIVMKTGRKKTSARFLDHHEKGLAFSDHAYIVTRPFLDGIETVFEIIHLYRQYAVALTQLIVFGLLSMDFAFKPGHFGKTALAHPESILECSNDYQQYGDHPFHR